MRPSLRGPLASIAQSSFGLRLLRIRDFCSEFAASATKRWAAPRSFQKQSLLGATAGQQANSSWKKELGGSEFVAAIIEAKFLDKSVLWLLQLALASCTQPRAASNRFSERFDYTYCTLC